MFTGMDFDEIIVASNQLGAPADDPRPIADHDETAPVAFAVSILWAQTERANGQEWTLLQVDGLKIHLAHIIGPAAL